jgi:UDP-N-acetylmuramoylalanine--D-glutamate ligase
MDFSNKKITVMGLGLLGRALGDVSYLAQKGAEIIVTDLKTKKELATSLKALKKYKNISYHLGGHSINDFKDRDIILHAPNAPRDSIYLKTAGKSKVLITQSTALFVLLTQGIILGITGTRGKSTTTHLVYHILKKYFKNKKQKVYLGGNIKGISTLAMLDKVKKGDIVVMELDSWQLESLGKLGISPKYAGVTTFMPDHLNYYKGNLDAYLEDKAQIFLHQKKEDTLVLSEDIAKIIFKKYKNKIKSKITVVKNKEAQKYDVKIPGEHNFINVSVAVKLCKKINVPEKIIKLGVESYYGVEGRLEFVKSIKDIKIYNDTCSTTPDATLVGLKALSSNLNAPKGPKIVLIMGGTDKNIDTTRLTDSIAKYAKAVILIPGTGSDKVREILRKKIIKFYESDTLKSAVSIAFKLSQKGDTILFSPAFASFEMFSNEFDRGEKFLKIVNKLK